MRFIKYYSLVLIAFNILSVLSKRLEPGIFHKNKEQKMQMYEEDQEVNKKLNILHTLNSLGESYMDLMQFVSENVINKIQDFISLDYHLTKKQTEFQYQNTGYNQYLYQNDMINEEEWKKEYRIKAEHRSDKMRILTDQSLQKERLKNKSHIREFNNFDHLKKKPTVLTVDSIQDVSEGELELTKPQSIRLLQQTTIPDNGEIIKFGLKDRCQNNSFAVLVEQTTYFCNGLMISEYDYKHLQPDQITKNNCTTRLLKFESCLCPVDFTGRRCEYETRVYCDLTITNSAECQEMYEFAYVSQYSGLPPCVTIPKDGFMNYQVKADCRNMLPPPKEPTVYGANSDFKILFNEKPPSEPDTWKPFTAFNYFYKTDKFMISRPRYITPQIQYINWNVLGNNVKDSYQQKFSLTSEQLTGQKTFNIALNFRNLDPSMVTSGRYTVEFNLFEEFKYTNKDPFVLVASGIQVMVFEQAGYDEPRANKTNKKLIIAIVILTLVIVFFLGYLIYYFYRQKIIKRNRSRVASALEDNSLHQNLTDQSPNRVPVLNQEIDSMQDPQQQSPQQ